MKDKKLSRDPVEEYYDSLNYAIFHHSTQVVCAVFGLLMLFSAYDKACAANILPSDLCRWSVKPELSNQSHESPDMVDFRKTYRQR